MKAPMRPRFQSSKEVLDWRQGLRLFRFLLGIYPRLLPTILVLILGGSLLVERLWCRYLCPLGAVFAIGGPPSSRRPRRALDPHPATVEGN